MTKWLKEIVRQLVFCFVGHLIIINTSQQKTEKKKMKENEKHTNLRRNKYRNQYWKNLNQAIGDSLN